MSSWRVPGRASLFLVCWRLLLVASMEGVDPSTGKNLSQANQDSVTVNSTNVESFKDIIKNLDNQTTVFLDIEVVELDHVVKLEASDVRIAGMFPASKTAIVCVDKKAGFQLRGNGTIFDNITVRNCRSTAVEVINPAASVPGENAEAVAATFRNVIFANNTDEFSSELGQVGGGGIGVQPICQVFIDNCTFENNGHAQGGAISAAASNITVVNTLFHGNVVNGSGGAINMVGGDTRTGTFVNITGCRFVGNQDILGAGPQRDIAASNGAPLESSEFIKFPTPPKSGGCVFAKDLSIVVIENSVFDSNLALPAGGALNLRDNNEVQLVNNTFRNNEAREGEGFDLSMAQGGAVYTATRTDSKHLFTNNRFLNNTASYGGALHLVTPVKASVQIVGTVFEENTAWLGGGAAVFRNTERIRLESIDASRNKAQVGGAIMMANAAGINVLGTSRDDATVFEENEALDGGALFFLGAGTVHAQLFQFVNNRARRNGGAVAAMDSLASGSITLVDSTYKGNIARRGGAIFVDSISAFNLLASTGHTSLFEDNAALAGGAIYGRLQNQVMNQLTLGGAQFRQNRAVNVPADVGYQLVRVPQREKTGQERRADDEEIEEAVVDPNSDDPCTPGGGGAMCLALTRLPERGSITIVMENSEFTNNSALIGGAVVVATDDNSVWLKPRNCSEEDTGAITFGSQPCRELGFKGVQFRDNTAVSAGGAVFVSNPNNVWIADEELRSNYSRLSDAGMANITGNTVHKGGFGPDVASTVNKLELASAMTENGLLAEDHLGGTPLPTIRLDVLDAFGQRISAGIPDAGLKVTAIGKCADGFDCVSGQRTADAEKGIVVFDSIRVNTPPGNFSLSLFAKDLDRVTEGFSIRDCVPGEFNITGQNICDHCTNNQYSFLPTVPCRDCDDNALCAGGAALVPIENYWHSSPFSTQFHQCLVEEACNFEVKFMDGNGTLVRKKRSDILTDFYGDLTMEEVRHAHDTGRVFSNEEYQQCRRGYMGVLCGSCEPEYGHLPGGECVECKYSRKVTACFISLVALWTLLLLGFAIRSALSSIRDMEEMEVLDHDNSMQAPGPVALTKVSCQSREDVGKLQIRVSSPSKHQQSKRGENAGAGGQGDLSAVVPKLCEPAARAQQVSVDHIKAAEKVSETLKIATNFLQVTGVAVAINVSWTRTVKKLLGLWDALVGFSNGSNLVAFDCVLDDEGLIPKSFRALIFRVVFPIILLVVVSGGFIIYYMYLTIAKNGKQRPEAQYLRSRIMISILAVIFFSYQNITEEFMRTVNCVDLDKDKSDNDVSDYTGFAIARGRYWGEDTAEKCYDGGHGKLAMFLGVPGLLLFSFGVPVFLLALLLWNQHRGRLKHREFLNTYGFVYQNYTEKHVYWEVVILIRKALIGGVVVFAYEAGPNLQGIMALGVLIAALVMHLIAVPFKYTTLNVLEGCSLIVSILTFYSGIVFDDGNTSPSAKILLSVILFVVNTGMTLYLLYKITQYVDQYVTARLKVVGVEDVPRSFPARCWRLLQTIVEQIATGEGRGRTLASVAQLTMQVMPNTGRGARPQQEKALPTTTDVGMPRS